MAGLSDVLLDAVRHHLVSDVPVVLFLSGGIDSACLGSLACKAGVQNMTAMTIGFTERQFDESDLSKRTAQALDIPHRTVTLSANQFGTDLDHAIWAMDQPTVDGLNSYWISRLASEAGFKVAISGQGGDELFGGYESWAWFERFYHFARLIRPFPAKSFGQFLDQPSLPFPWRKLSYLFRVQDPLVASQLAVKVMFLERDSRRLLPAMLIENGHNSEAERHLAYWTKFVEKHDLKEKLAFMDIHSHLEPRLLRDLDAMSMAHSLEVRPVYLDNQLVEFLVPIPPSIRMQQKRLLLEATKPFIPKALHVDLLSRRKRTFTFPFSLWLRRDLWHAVQETLAPERVREVGILDPIAVGQFQQRYERWPAAVGWSRIWSLFVLQRWCETMKVKP